MKIDLTGKTILVTGGASGIGASCARHAHACGARVIVADRKLDAAQNVAGALPGATAIGFDVVDEQAVIAAIVQIEAEVGPIDGMVHSAGVLQRTSPPDALTMDEWDFVTRVDLRGSYLMASKVGARMAERGRGSIVLVASIGGICSSPLHGYSPAKAGVISIAQCLAAEWGPRGVRTNAISPGFTATPALDKGINAKSMDVTAMSESSALQRLLTPDEVAAPALFLLSDLAAGITGINLPVDAGYLVGSAWQGFGGLR